MASNLFDKLAENVSNIGNKISENVANVTSNVQKATSNVANTSENIGKNINQGFQGVSNNVKSRTSVLTNVFNNFGEKIGNSIPYNSSRALNSSAEFINSNNIIAHIIFLVLVIILFIAFFRAGINIISLIMTPDSSPYLYKNMKNAKQLVIIPQDPKSKGSISILRSRNEYDGLEFSYSTWIYIDDATYRGSQMYKHIFHKGNDYLGNDGIYYPNNSPGLYLFNGNKGHIENPNKLDSYDYKYPVMGLLVRQNIFTNESDGEKTFYEDVEVEGIPIKKWVNIIVRVDNQNILDVFINGKLMKRKKLSGVARQNYDNLYINMNGGFSGYLSSLRYYNYSLGTFEISSIVSNGPSLKLESSSNMAESKPKYLSSKWFFSSSNPIYN
jgi:hypothetical protein